MVEPGLFFNFLCSLFCFFTLIGPCVRVQASVLSGNGSNYAANGTPSFMAPELFQVSGSNPDGIDLHKTDIWSLGVTLYFMVMGRTPWQVGNEIELAHCVQNMVIQFPDEKVDPHLKFLLRQMLERNFNKRIDLNGVLTDDWVTQEGTDPLLSEQEVIDEETRPHTGHVLLVESSASSRNHVSLKLDQANCTHMIACSVAEAVESVKLTLKPSQFAVTKFGCVLVGEECIEGGALELLTKLQEIGYEGYVVALSNNVDNSNNNSTENVLQSQAQQDSENSFKANFLKQGGTAVWSKNVHSIDIIQLFARLSLASVSTDSVSPISSPNSDAIKQSLNQTDGATKKDDKHHHHHAKPEDVVLSVQELKEAVVHIPPRPESAKGINTYGSADSFGISEISSRLTSPAESIDTSATPHSSTTDHNQSIHSLGSVSFSPNTLFGNTPLGPGSATSPNPVKIIPRKLSKKGTMEASFMMSESDFHLGNSFLPRVNSLEPYNMSLKKQGSERTLSRTRDFMLVPADIVLIPSKVWFEATVRVFHMITVIRPVKWHQKNRV
jgi:hypothetical protein